MKTKISAKIDSELLAKLEKQTKVSRSQLLEDALRHYQSFLIQQKLKQFYSQHEETAEEQYAADIAEMNIDSAIADD